MWKITSKHIDLFNFIKESNENDNEWFNIEQIKEILNFASSYEVMEVLNDLIKLGYLGQDFDILKDIVNENIFHLPFYWFAQCWNYWKEILDNYPREKFSIDVSDLPRWDVKTFFVTRAKGDSMEPFIKSWDDVLIQSQPNYNDENDLLLVIHNNKPKIKRLKYIGGKKYLVSLNKEHKDIEIEEFYDDIDIVWIVRKNFSNNS